MPAQDYPGGFYLGLSTQTPVGANEDGTDLFGGSYQFIVNDANASTVYGSCIGGTADGRPHLLTAVYSGNSLGGIGNLYVDGRKVTGDCHFSFGGLSGVHGRIGTYDNYPSTPKYSNTAYPTFPGVIGDIRYVNFAMTDAQVANLYALTAPSVCAGPAPCTTY